MTETPYETDVAFIRALAELLRENDLTELRVKRDYGEADSLDVRVCRGAPVAPPAPALPAPQAQAPVAAPADDRPDDQALEAGAVSSPMVGTVYLSPEPGAAPFVRPGDSVAEGDTLLIVEAMKTMNHIPAPHAGTVKSILVGDGTPVEFGAPLLILS